ncbi:AMP-dependent synthetase/ligase [Alkalitalea saponilacus]|uniref:Long-chain acyl-CoA synthetase n=1 Tax=Alkalitalea saponilacus TaxID=889453 RepID=A0A1T5HQW7_9BACT|nr:long-chain fatty acid--CoA ligase [Alkalitalea saponilacus]ASB48419.1 long-chain fatty acid--CoA ligase [Alkalitalea saponilacus]SKC23007.1 long-chain acyl-CoA synthetase [Alkalitalea saponilacus]
MSKRIVAENLALFYREAARCYGDLPAFATRKRALEWHPVSYRKLYEQGLDLATGLIELGVNAREHIGLFGDNRYEWMLADYAVQFCGAADVPRGTDVTDSELVYIINHAGIRFAFVETVELQKRVLELRDQLPLLKEIILMDPNGHTENGVKKLVDVLNLGSGLRIEGDRRTEDRMTDIKPEDLFTLIYTSGTTGTPKGVMLTHSNIISQIKTLPGIHNCNDRVLSILPIWHVFERVIEMYTISFGGCTYYSSVKTLGEDLRNVEPTFMASAPRVWEKLHERIIKGVKSSHPVRQILFHIAYYLSKQFKASEYYITNRYLKLQHQSRWKHWLMLPLHILRWVMVLPWYGFFNVAVLERIRLGAGGALKTTISGGGALPAEIDQFFNNVGIPVLEGYGMTETSPVISVRPSNNLIVGTVGPPLPETQIKIVDPVSGNVMYPSDQFPYGGRGIKGEIWIKGPQVMKGYYKEPELTKQTIKKGWLKTGDLGMITHNNCLKILGRCKATIVLSNGENVEPEPIEMRLQQSQYIDHCMLVGQDKKFISALIVPVLSEFHQIGIPVNSGKELIVNHPEVQKIIREEIRRMTSNGSVRYQQIKDFRLLPDGFQVGEELTNLHKLKRHVIQEKYNHVIEELFASESI